MALTGTFKVWSNFQQTKSADFEAATSVISHTLALTFTDGTAAGSADRIWKDTRTLSASASENLDLSGSLTNIYGDAVVFADVRAILITAASANMNNVNVTRPSTSPETGLPLFLASGDGIAVRPGGLFAWACPDATGIPVTATTADILTLTNSAGGTDVTYSITIVGASA